MTTEDGALLRENAVHTHPPSQVQWIEWCKRCGHVPVHTERFGYIGKVTKM